MGGFKAVLAISWLIFQPFHIRKNALFWLDGRTQGGGGAFYPTLESSGKLPFKILKKEGIDNNKKNHLRGKGKKEEKRGEMRKRGKV